MVKRDHIILCLILCIASNFSPFFYSFACINPENPIWWEIKIILVTTGDYRLENKGIIFSGKYSFTASWTGCMEKDDSDYLLYHLNSEIIRWEAQENGVFADSTKLLLTNDFLDKPSFNFNYVLKQGEDLHFSFVVKGFLVPQNDSSEKFYLNLPTSKENSQNLSKTKYNSYVSKGTNSVSLKDKEIYIAPLEKKFAWEWKHQDPLLGEKTTLSIFESHRVMVNLSITPH